MQPLRNAGKENETCMGKPRKEKKSRVGEPVRIPVVFSFLFYSSGEPARRLTPTIFMVHFQTDQNSGIAMQYTMTGFYY